MDDALLGFGVFEIHVLNVRILGITTVRFVSSLLVYQNGNMLLCIILFPKKINCDVYRVSRAGEQCAE